MMDLLNLIFGIVTVFSFFFSVFVYKKSLSRRKVEEEKNAYHKERLNNMKIAMHNLLVTIDAIIQMPKTGSISVAQLQNVARIARAEGFSIAKNIDKEVSLTDSWKFGKNPFIDTIDEPNQAKKDS